MKRVLRCCLIPFSVILMQGCQSPDASADVTISTSFPGGNALVEKMAENTIRIRPDLRGGNDWFYWYFEAKADKPGRATFVLPQEDVGVGGPAISRDGGRNWQWLGIENVKTLDANAKPPLVDFTYDFAKAGESVRFSVGIPYVQSNLDVFLNKHANNPYLTKSTLTQSRKGRAVELLQVGQPGIGKQALLLTARHHACEALASYALEGFLQEAISESPAAEEFRKKYVLYAVPFVDKDGVEEGDQGKGRKPHDHNRDYGEAPLYPEIQAIEKLADEKKITFSMDLHCPYIKGDIHEAFHFLGLGVPHVKDNLTEWISWMSEERPPQVMAPLQFLVDPKKPNAVNKSINSHYFATRDGVLLAATLEIPYNQTDLSLNADMLRAYGAAMLQAWNHMAFVATDGGTREGSSYSDLEKWRYQFRSTYRREPDKTAAALQAQIDDPKTTPLYRAEALIGLAKVRAQQKRYADAAASCTAALKVDGVMNSQRAEATILRMQVLAEAPDSATTAFAANLEEALRFPYLSKRQQTQLYEAAVDFHQSRKQYEDAIAAARQQFTVAADYQQGQILNRVAALYELQMQPDKALATRREAVALLKAQIGDKANRSVFGATMVKEYFAAVMAVPTSTLAEKKAAADLVLNHDIVLPADKEKVRKQIEALAAP